MRSNNSDHNVKDLSESQNCVPYKKAWIIEQGLSGQWTNVTEITKNL